MLGDRIVNTIEGDDDDYSKWSAFDLQYTYRLFGFKASNGQMNQALKVNFPPTIFSVLRC